MGAVLNPAGPSESLQEFRANAQVHTRIPEMWNKIWGRLLLDNHYDPEIEIMFFCFSFCFVLVFTLDPIQHSAPDSRPRVIREIVCSCWGGRGPHSERLREAACLGPHFRFLLPCRVGTCLPCVSGTWPSRARWRSCRSISTGWLVWPSPPAPSTSSPWATSMT